MRTTNWRRQIFTFLTEDGKSDTEIRRHSNKKKDVFQKLSKKKTKREDAFVRNKEKSINLFIWP